MPNHFYETIGIAGADVVYPSFYLSANVGSVDGGSTITATFPNGGASLLTKILFGTVEGVITPVDDNSATITTPALDAGIVDVTGSFTGYDDYVVKNGWTAKNLVNINGITPVCIYEGVDQQITLSGDYFQSSSGSVLLNATNMDIVSWANNKIVFNGTEDLDIGIYDIKVITVSGADYTLYSGFEIEASIGDVPLPPLELSVEALGLTSLKQSWEYVPDTTSFEIYRSEEISGTYIQLPTVTTNSNVDINLSSGTDYWYKVKSKNSIGTSDFSLPVKGTTLTEEQASKPFYYPKIIRRSVIALLDMFNDLKIQKYDSTGTLVKTVNVPILFAPQEKYMLLNKRDAVENPHLYKNMPIPRISLAMDGISYNANRSYSPNENIYYSDGTDLNLLSEYVKNINPAPYDFNFTLYIRTNTFNDFTQIVEQILPYFNPELYLRIKEFSFLNVERNLKVNLNGTTTDFIEPQTQEDIRYVNGTISLTVDGFMYRPISSSKLIKKITANFNIIEPEEDKLVSTYMVDSLGISGTPLE
jgi:hypothetical protein